MTSECCGIVCAVPEMHVAIVTKLGQYERILRAGGPYCINPLYEAILTTQSLKQVQMPINVSAKTADNTTLQLDIMVQYAISDQDDGIYNSVFKLNDPSAQIRKYVEDVVRTKVAMTEMNQVFEAKDDIATAIKTQLKDTMEKFGFNIRETPVINVDPPMDVKRAMNEKNKKRFLYDAATSRAARLYKLQVAKAEAEANKSLLRGQGIALQRQRIAEGLNETVQDFQKGVGDVTAKDVLELVLIIQYFDMMKDIGRSNNCKTTFMPNVGQSKGVIDNGFMQSMG